MFKDKSLLELDGVLIKYENLFKNMGLQTSRTTLALVYILYCLLIVYIMTQLLQTLFNLYFHY